jgi:hypothetical protein
MLAERRARVGAVVILTIQNPKVISGTLFSQRCTDFVEGVFMLRSEETSRSCCAKCDLPQLGET